MALVNLSALLLWLAAAVAGPVGHDVADEHDVKAAFVYNFGKFVQWPDELAGKETELRICVLEAGRLQAALSRLVSGKQLQGKTVQVRTIGTPAQSAGCHILFIGSDSTRSAEVLKNVGEAPVLTVSDAGDFLERGGAIALFVEDRRVRFSVNLKATTRAGLKVSSQLLRVARSVRN